ncbi:hypothetical protein [Runella sp.]|uniref:hypothetical protein n=1 Tax=Runella sp. TaxID=1960881 RepID=UPI002615512E|nr:hypothetical protein [Runella sp.]
MPKKSIVAATRQKKGSRIGAPTVQSFCRTNPTRTAAADRHAGQAFLTRKDFFI